LTLVLILSRRILSSFNKNPRFRMEYSQSFFKPILSPWEKGQVRRISDLSDSQVLKELREIMCEYKYSWQKISRYLLEQLCSKTLKLCHFEPGKILYEWIVLCDERTSWKRLGGPSLRSFKFNRECLINLMIIPTQAGMGSEGMSMTSVKPCIQN